LFIVNGHAIRYPTGKGIARLQKPVLLHNDKGRFKKMSKRIGSYQEKGHLSRGLALGDLDNDGKIDAVIANINEPLAVLRNVADNGNHWVGFQLIGKDYADFVGAKVMVTTGERTQTRFAKGGGSYCSSPDRRLVFGLGDFKTINSVSVLWPNGKTQVWQGIKVDGYYRLTQGKEEAEIIKKR
jgi:hypothetical protein